MNTNQKIKSSIDIIEYHLGQYRNYKNESQKASTKVVRERASEMKFTHAEYILDELQNSVIHAIISDGNPFQFEEFLKFVESDTIKYLSIIKSSLQSESD